jgi:hypothetical protein
LGQKSSFGAYGLRLGGIDEALLTALPDEVRWPDVRVARELAAADHRPERLDSEVADIPLEDGDRALVRRADRSATWVTSTSEDDGSLLHPFLTTAAVVFAWWDGRHAFHGGSFAGPQGAWGVLGDGGSGKSSTLARLALHGLPILSDDLVVVSQGQVLAGPRFIDLRELPAGELGLEHDAVRVRDGQRFRYPTGPAAAEVPLRGLLFLSWADEVSLRPLSPTERLVGLSRQRCTATESSPSLLELVPVPAWRLSRPAGWSSLEPAVDRILELVRA